MPLEYKLVRMKTGSFWGGKVNIEDMQDKLNGYASEGWRVINVITTNMTYGATKDVIAILERQS